MNPHPCVECPFRAENRPDDPLAILMNRGLCHMDRRDVPREQRLPCRGDAHHEETGEYWASRHGAKRGRHPSIERVLSRMQGPPIKREADSLLGIRETPEQAAESARRMSEAMARLEGESEDYGCDRP